MHGQVAECTDLCLLQKIPGYGETDFLLRLLQGFPVAHFGGFGFCYIRRFKILDDYCNFARNLCRQLPQLGSAQREVQSSRPPGKFLNIRHETESGVRNKLNFVVYFSSIHQFTDIKQMVDTGNRLNFCCIRRFKIIDVYCNFARNLCDQLPQVELACREKCAINSSSRGLLQDTRRNPR